MDAYGRPDYKIGATVRKIIAVIVEAGLSYNEAKKALATVESELGWHQLSAQTVAEEDRKEYVIWGRGAGVNG